MTPSTRMPEDAARAGLSETARIALPIRVFISATHTTVIVDDRDDHDRDLLGGRSRGAEVAARAWSVYCDSDWVELAKKYWKT